jgi:phage host-nuclease inhibitor protein Gam
VANATAATRDAQEAARRAALVAEEVTRLDRQVGDLEAELARVRPAAADAGEESRRARRAREAAMRKLRAADGRVALAQEALDRLRRRP